MLTLSLQRAPTTRDLAAYPLFQRSAVLRWVRRSFKLADFIHPAELTLRLVDEAEGRSLNHSYRKKDYATNVLTFDYARPPQEPVLMADILVCAPVVEREAREQNKTLEHHLAHLVVHGTLHALGYDHETSPADAQAMEALEVGILESLHFPHPYR